MNQFKTIEEDEKAIHELLEAVIIAFNKADLEKLLSLHSEDIILTEPNMPTIQGKNQVRKLFAEFKKQQLEMQLAFDILELQVSQDIAFVRGQVIKMVLQSGEKLKKIPADLFAY